MKKILSFILFISFLSCGDDDCSKLNDSECISFDIRQCQTDLFADEIDENGSQEERENQMTAWLLENSIDVENVKLELNFHEAVCEACDVCPQGDRYFIQYSLGSSLESLNLLNVTSEDCCDLF